MKLEKIDGSLFKKALTGAAGLLEKNKEEVNALNVFPVPDGDTGTNMSLTMQSALKQGLSSSSINCYEIALATSQGSLMGARGNSGVILSQLFRGFATGIKGCEQVDVEFLAKGLKQASDTAYKAVMKPTEGTILTVARECGEFAMANYKNYDDILEFLKNIIEYGNMILDKTPEMLPVLKEAGVVDAGGKGFLYVLSGAYGALAGIEVFEIPGHINTSEKNIGRREINSGDIEFAYCTEFMINGNIEDIELLRGEFSERGDSLLVVDGDGIIKVHVHTNHPGLVLERAMEIGELTDIKIDNMRYQHEEVLLKEELKKNPIENKRASKKYSFVSVSIGKGIDQVFEGLNVDKIVSGGQTMNPSTEDILKALESTDGENVFILPNNKNIILAAEQTKELTEKNVFVIQSKSVPEGIGAILSFDESLSPEENFENMNEALKDIITGQITFAVRDTEFNGKEIKKDDIIGIANGEIQNKGSSPNQVAMDLIDQVINEDIGIISIFYGEDIKEDEAEKLRDILEERYEDIDIELLFGGQPLYYYVFSLE